jgi:hypothetical protein
MHAARLAVVAVAMAALAATSPAPAAQSAMPTAMENPFAGAPTRSEIAEARRLVKKGKELRAANTRRRGAENAPDAKSVSELVPRYLKAAPAGWSVSEQGFVFDIVRPDGAQICQAIDSMRDGETFFCTEDQGSRHRLVMPF